MLIVTDAAAAAVRSLMEEGVLPVEGGIRLQPPPPSATTPSPVVELARVLGPRDAVVIDHGIRVFLDPQLVPLDQDLAIDVAKDDQDRAVFVVREPA